MPLQEADRIVPEEARVHYVGRAVTREHSSSPDYGHDQNYATSPNDSEYCPRPACRLYRSEPPSLHYVRKCEDGR